MAPELRRRSAPWTKLAIYLVALFLLHRVYVLAIAEDHDDEDRTATKCVSRESAQALVRQWSQTTVDTLEFLERKTPSSERRGFVDEIRYVRNVMPLSETGVIVMGLHGSLSRIKRMGKMIADWKGPVSVAMIACTERDARRVWSWRTQLLQENPELASTFFSLSIVIMDFYYYPANLLRNVAVEGARAGKFKWITTLDADSPTNHGMRDVLKDVVKGETLYNSSPPTPKSSSNKPRRHTLFVFPCYDMINTDRCPKDRKELETCVKNGTARITLGHIFPGHQTWLLPTTTTLATFPKFLLDLTEGEERKDPHYPEPYSVMEIETATRIPYDERIIGRGFDKISHFFELFASDEFNLRVLPDSFVCNLPNEGLSSVSQKQAERQERNDGYYRGEFRRRIIEKYGAGSRRFKWLPGDERWVGE